MPAQNVPKEVWNELTRARRSEIEELQQTGRFHFVLYAPN
jgi:hypothetical protein